MSTDNVGNERTTVVHFSVVAVPPTGEADVQITKTAAPTDARPGDLVTYSLKARNVGDAIADDASISDALPAGLTFVSADAPCSESSGTVSCHIGSLNPGEEKTYLVRATVDQWGTADPAENHLLDVQKTELQIDLDAGQTRTVFATCPSGYVVSDGSVRTDHIDQGTGDWDSTEVLESRASSIDTWTATVGNTATGRAQAKIFAVCIKRTTAEDNGHSHDLIVTDQITASDEYLAGEHEATLQCGPGQVAVQPGFKSTAPVDLVLSQPDGNGWKFKLDVHAPAAVTFSIRCLTRQVSVSHGHTHDLSLLRISTGVEIGAGKVHEAQLTCPDGSKGIVAGWDLDHGLLPLGNDPRPVTRAFKLHNPTGHPLTARLTLLCLGNLTEGEHLGAKAITNSASISTTSDESETGNNSSSAQITAEDTDIHTPIVVDPTPDKPTPNNPIAGRIASIHGGVMTLSVTCPGACSGTAKVASTATIKAVGKKFKKGTVLAKGGFKVTQAGTATVRIKTTGAGKKLFKLKKVQKKMKLLISGS